MIDGERLKQKMRAGVFKLVHFDADERRGWYFDHVAFDNLVDSCPAPIQPPARIEAAIRHFDKKDKSRGSICGQLLRDFGRWVLGQDQNTWKDRDLGLEEEK